MGTNPSPRAFFCCTAKTHRVHTPATGCKAMQRRKNGAPQAMRKPKATPRACSTFDAVHSPAPHGGSAARSRVRLSHREMRLGLIQHVCAHARVVLTGADGAVDSEQDH